MNYSTSTKAFKLEGVPQLKKTLAEITATLNGAGQTQFHEKLRDVMMVPAKMIRDEAKDLVPVVTGKLRAAIFAVPMKERPGALAGVHVAEARYAPYVEYGTSKMDAQPYLRPAILATRPLAANIIAGGLRPLIDEIARQDAWHASSGAPV